jgi:hypothetical protein
VFACRQARGAGRCRQVAEVVIHHAAELFAGDAADGDGLGQHQRAGLRQSNGFLARIIHEKRRVWREN